MNPRIESNYIESNRKSGIKLDNMARAHIGGKEMFNFLPNTQVKQDGDGALVGDPKKLTEEYEILYKSLFEDCIGNVSANTSMLNYHDLLSAVGEFKEQIDFRMNKQTLAQGNVINSNYA